MSARPFHVNAFAWPNGYHESAWRVVEDDVGGVLELTYYTDISRIAERGLMNSIFLAARSARDRSSLQGDRNRLSALGLA